MWVFSAWSMFLTPIHKAPSRPVVQMCLLKGSIYLLIIGTKYLWIAVNVNTALHRCTGHSVILVTDHIYNFQNTVYVSFWFELPRVKLLFFSLVTEHVLI